MTGYLALFLLMLAGEIGLIDRSGARGGDTTPDGETDAEPDTDGDSSPEPENGTDDAPGTPADLRASLYDASDYSGAITGTDGDDTFTASAANLAWFLGDGNDSLDASAAADFIDGGTGDDTILAREGDDIVLAGTGDDVVDGGTGNDLIYGEDGDDRLTGNMGNDSIYGGNGNDTLLGGSDSDLLDGGAGDDYLSGMGFDLATSTRGIFDGGDTLVGGEGTDTLHLGPQDIGTGGAGADLFRLDHTRPEIAGLVTVTDFDSAEDLLEILYVPAGGAPDPVVTVTEGAANVYTVALDGQALAEISSLTPVTPSMVRLVPQSA